MSLHREMTQDVLMVYAAAEGKVIMKPSYTEPNLLARDLKWR